jgi:hypothetical protein
MFSLNSSGAALGYEERQEPVLLHKPGVVLSDRVRLEGVRPRQVLPDIERKLPDANNSHYAGRVSLSRCGKEEAASHDSGRRREGVDITGSLVSWL